ncbi:uncharacterized protein LOC117527924 [Thalassophryne amazonica]|uniref:uncharacterized protein LOC117527924 n=1 Tax=Thalassophryne amazonica TaxID=390379 RepID=UPI001472247F|nr:uncharacterized protein LOC117527924 [Thalassophryne amazonica]
MVYCFAFGCNHKSGRNKCGFFRFPLDTEKRGQWERSCRRADRSLDMANDRICSCHFVDAAKLNGPTLFLWTMGKVFSLPKSRASSCKKPKRTFLNVFPRPSVSANRNKDVAMTLTAPPLPPALTQQELLAAENKELRRRIQNLEVQVASLLIASKKKRSMTIGDICGIPEKMLFYTSLQYDVFCILISSLKRFELKYFYAWKVKSLSLEDQLLVTLMKLRLNLRNLDLAHRFGSSETTIGNVIKTFICALHDLLFDRVVDHKIPSQAICKGSMPKSFQEFISDAMEVTQDIQGDLGKESSAYSNYKSWHAVKVEPGVNLNSDHDYCSNVYPGSTSEAAIVQDCGLLHSLEAGDLIVADKGFTIKKFIPLGVNLSIPPFLASKSQFLKEEAELCRTIARAQINMERANFQIVHDIPANLRPLSIKIIQLCSCLSNLQPHLLAETTD